MTGICAQVLPLTMSEPLNNHAFFEAAVSRLMDRLYGAAMRFTRNASDDKPAYLSRQDNGAEALKSNSEVEKA